MEPRISIITLGVSDFVRSLRFYRDGLGWPTRATDASDIAFFNTAGTRFAIYPLEKLAVGSRSVFPDRLAAMLWARCVERHALLAFSPSKM